MRDSEVVAGDNVISSANHAHEADKRMGYLGIDIGSTTVKVVLLNSNRVHLAPPIYSRSNGNPRRALNKALVVIHEHFSGPVRIGITGSGRKIARSLLGLPPSNCLTEINAHALGAWHERPDVRSVIDIGGQDSKIIRLKPGKHGTPEVEDFMMNELCASGTGAFLEMHARELGYADMDGFSRAAAPVLSLWLDGKSDVHAENRLAAFMENVKASCGM